MALAFPAAGYGYGYRGGCGGHGGYSPYYGGPMAPPMGYSNGMMPLAAPAYQPVVVASPVISPQFIDPMPTLYSAAGAEFVTGPDQTGLALNHWRN